MSRNVFFSLLLTFVTVGLGAASSSAQTSLANLDHYTLLPRLSRLHQSGGIAGRELDYLLTGKYDLLRDSPGTASFENAEVWGSIISPFPTPAIVYDIDQLLNLEGLRGELLPIAAPFDIYEFTGKISDGSSIRIFGSVIGPWMYLRGGTTPPPGSADFFTYQLKALARTRPFADANDDGVVDAADFVALRNSPASLAADKPTFADWTMQFGERIPDVAAYDAMLTTAIGSLAPATAVPEPATFAFAMTACVALHSIRRRHRSRH